MVETKCCPWASQTAHGEKICTLHKSPVWLNYWWFVVYYSVFSFWIFKHKTKLPSATVSACSWMPFLPSELCMFLIAFVKCVRCPCRLRHNLESIYLPFDSEIHTCTHVMKIHQHSVSSADPERLLWPDLLPKAPALASPCPASSTTNPQSPHVCSKHECYSYCTQGESPGALLYGGGLGLKSSHCDL